MENEKIVEVKNLKKQYGDNIILKDINLYINRGEVVSLIGPSGSGKSTILRCIVDLESITSGEILIEGNNLADKNIDKKIKKEMLLKTGMVFQTFNLFPHLSVRNNIVKTLKLVKKIDTSEAEAITKKMLDLVGLSDKMNSFPNELSGGQKQRVAIARALALQPDILLFDEPTSALDPELIGEVLKVIKDMVKENMTMIIVTHEMQFAREVSDYIVFVDGGTIIAEGKPEEIFVNSQNQRLQNFLKRYSESETDIYSI